jgi:hypothetical protein
MCRAVLARSGMLWKHDSFFYFRIMTVIVKNAIEMILSNSAAILYSRTFELLF